MDYSACAALDNLLEICDKKDRPIVFQNVKPHVYKMLKEVVKQERLYLCNEESNVCESLPARKCEQIMLPLMKSEKDVDQEEPV